MQNEDWKIIIGFIDYEVSNLGRVRRAIDSRSGNFKSGHILAEQEEPKSKYPQVGLTRNGKQYWRRVHVLVCTSFRGPKPFDGAQIRHLDGVRSNCTLDNLVWGTRLENTADMVIHGLRARGDRHHYNAKLTVQQARDFRARHAEARLGRKRVPPGWLAAEAKAFGITVFALGFIIRGQTYAD